MNKILMPQLIIIYKKLNKFQENNQIIVLEPNKYITRL